MFGLEPMNITPLKALKSLSQRRGVLPNHREALLEFGGYRPFVGRVATCDFNPVGRVVS
jgi:hypothetical protein